MQKSFLQQKKPLQFRMSPEICFSHKVLHKFDWQTAEVLVDAIRKYRYNIIIWIEKLNRQFKKDIWPLKIQTLGLFMYYIIILSNIITYKVGSIKISLWLNEKVYLVINRLTIDSNSIQISYRYKNYLFSRKHCFSFLEAHKCCLNACIIHNCHTLHVSLKVKVCIILYSIKGHIGNEHY